MFSLNKNKTSEKVAEICVGKADTAIRLEGYDRLKDNVLYMNTDGKTKVFQIESSVAGEGKTTVAGNLAVSLGLTDKKVVVVDLDFRRSRLHRLFGISKETGIADYFLGNATLEDITKDSGYKNVDVITRGSEVHNPALILVSDKFKALIAELKEKYDYVLLDCAPVLLVSDYIHISKVSDGVLFMVAHASTTKKQVAEAVKELRKNGANILGSVFTMYDNKKDKDFYGYGSYYKYQRDARCYDEDN